MICCAVRYDAAPGSLHRHLAPLALPNLAVPIIKRRRCALPPKARAAHAGPRRAGHARTAPLIRHAGPDAGSLAADFADQAQPGQPPRQYGPALARTSGARRPRTPAPWGLDPPWRPPFSSLRAAAAIVPLHPISSGDSPRFGLTMSTWSTTTRTGKARAEVRPGSRNGPLSVRGCPSTVKGASRFLSEMTFGHP